MDFTGRPAQLILIASVARRYYLEGKSKIEIAEELGLSRFKVAARSRPPVKFHRHRLRAGATMPAARL
jgi:hypothetical protein